MFKGQKIDLFRKFTRKCLRVKQFLNTIVNDETQYMNIKHGTVIPLTVTFA